MGCCMNLEAAPHARSGFFAPGCAWSPGCSGRSLQHVCLGKRKCLQHNSPGAGLGQFISSFSKQYSILFKNAAITLHTFGSSEAQFK